METVLVVGSTGNIGIAAVIGALRSRRNVIAIVRNQASAEKLYMHVGTREGITTVEADITSDHGVQGVVDLVKTGKLPAFQHVYSAAGGLYGATLLHELGIEELHQYMNVNFEANFFAYRATMPYLLEQNNPNSTWTLCTGGMGDLGTRAAPALTQGVLYSMANVACRDNENTNVRFNEVYLALRVEVDESAEKTGFFKASAFAATYCEILARPDIRSCRISVCEKEDMTELKFKEKRCDMVLKKDD
ncbi:hypothetical protein BP5796_12262 [Coleophoma crateriformis]|uniref:Uncharacterized protein n=1 Tax=Coleophoma crateriformis TaxID=565419 RepID=A0A3D8Q920_9HELO|nr:hypothetical protein BP5796_12262 [Coleophoma crateriformis]